MFCVTVKPTIKANINATELLSGTRWSIVDMVCYKQSNLWRYGHGKRTQSIAGRRWRMWCIPLEERSEMGT